MILSSPSVFSACFPRVRIIFTRQRQDQPLPEDYESHLEMVGLSSRYLDVPLLQLRLTRVRKHDYEKDACACHVIRLVCMVDKSTQKQHGR